MTSRNYSAFYIGGKWLPPQSDAVCTVVSPRSEERIGSVPSASAADIDAAVGAARHAFDETDWSVLPVAEYAAGPAGTRHGMSPRPCSGWPPTRRAT
jgi:aldehyde dehydrogenase (NAD+)